MSDGSFICGVDVGGSKTECAICTADGTVLSSALTDGVAFRRDEAELAAVVMRAVDEACAAAAIDSGDLGTVVAGVAGVDTPALQQHAQRAIAAAFPAARVVVDNDATIALEAATSQRPAGVLMGGTGSIAYGEDARGRGHRVSGWGHIFGDEGSGYDIAVRAVSSVLRALDGRGEQTSLCERMLSHFSLDDPRDAMELTHVVACDPSAAAAFAPQVFAAQRDGDAVADAIVAGAADELAAIGIRLLELLEPSGAATLVLGGSLLEHVAQYAALVEERIAAALPAARVVRTTLPPVAGGLLKGVAAVAGDLDREALRRSLAEGFETARAELAGQTEDRRTM